jgi:hypothetical protein
VWVVELLNKWLWFDRGEPFLLQWMTVLVADPESKNFEMIG